MVIKLKEGCLVNLDNIKIANLYEVVEGIWNIEISYYDDKKNPKAYVRCDSEEEGKQLIDKLLDEINNSNTVKVGTLRR